MSDEYPLMAFIANEGVAPKGERYDRSALVTDTVNKLYKKTEKGDFIYSSNNLETGSIGLNKYGKACISPVYSIFEPTGIADSDFLGRRLVRKDFINAMVKWRQGVIYGQWRIHESDFLKIEITVPSVEEQRKIGTYLDQLDHLITLHQRQPFLHSTPDISLSVRLIYPFYTSSWEQRKVSDLAEKTYGGGTPTTSNEAYWNGDIPWIQSSDVVDGKLLGVEPRKWITQDGLNNSAAQLIPGNSIAIITRVGVGKLAFMPYSYATSQDFLSLSKLNAEPLFTVYACYKKLQSELNAVQGTSIKGITKDELLAKNIMVPRYTEQQQIGAFFKQLDNLITLHQRECISFTGRADRLILTANKKRTTSSWEQRKFGEITSKYEDPVPTPHDGYYRLGIRSHAKGTFHSYVAKGQELETAQMHRVAAGNFIVNITFGWEHAVAITDKNDAGKLVSHRFPQFSFAEGMVPEFFRYVIVDEKFRHHLWLASPGGAGRNRVLKLDEMLNYLMRFPSRDEQIKIAEFFRHLDNLITLHQRKCANLCSPSQVVFSLLFVTSTFSWEQRKLTEFVEFFSGLTYTPNDVQENGTLVLRSSNVSNGEVVDADNVYVNPQVVNSENVKVGDIVVVVRNGSRSLIGKHAQIKAFMPNTVIGAFMTGIRSECPEFTNALLNTSRFEEEIAMNMGATINQITGYMFSKMEFKVPCLDEQKKIGEYFEKLDRLVTLHQRKEKAAVSGCSNDANNSKGVCCKARDFGYKCHKKDESK